MLKSDGMMWAFVSPEKGRLEEDVAGVKNRREGWKTEPT